MIMSFNPLHNFISPVKGKIPLPTGYTLVGDNKGLSTPSPIIKDIKLDIISLRRGLDEFETLQKLDHNRIWVGNYLNEPEERLQLGVINLPTLAEAVFPNPLSPITGDFRIPNPTFDYLSPSDWVMSGPFLPQIYATKYDTLGNPIGTDVSSSLAMTQVRAAQIMKRFDNASFIVGSSTVDFAWENLKMYLIPEQLKQLYGLGTTYTFKKAQSLGDLATGLLKNTVTNNVGVLSCAIPGKDFVEVGAAVENMMISLIRPENIVEGQDTAKLLTRSQYLPFSNLTNLSTGKIWKGVDGRPTELTLKEAGIAPNNIRYIIQQPNSELTSAQALSNLAILGIGGIMKVDGNGEISLASGGKLPIANDYVRPLDLQQEVMALESSIATVGAEASAAATAAAAAGTTATGAATAAATALAATVALGISKESSSDHDADMDKINNRVDSVGNRISSLSVNLSGVVTGSGNLKDTISMAFSSNPYFPGVEYARIPSGKISERPGNPSVGMIRCNTEI